MASDSQDVSSHLDKIVQRFKLSQEEITEEVKEEQPTEE